MPGIDNLNVSIRITLDKKRSTLRGIDPAHSDMNIRRIRLDSSTQ